MGIAAHIARLRAVDGELSEVAWITPSDLPHLPLTRFCRALLRDTGRI